MAVPTLAAMAALTLLQHPEAQPLDVTLDYSPFAEFARRIQRAVRGKQGPRRSAAVQIQSNYRRMQTIRQLGATRPFQNPFSTSKYINNLREMLFRVNLQADRNRTRRRGRTREEWIRLRLFG